MNSDTATGGCVAGAATTGDAKAIVSTAVVAGVVACSDSSPRAGPWTTVTTQGEEKHSPAAVLTLAT